MFVAGSLLIFAAVASQRSALSSRSASLSVSAQVVRPAEVSDPVLTSYGAVVAIRNAEQATVTVDDGTVRQTDAGNKVVELRPGASATITLKY